MRNHLWRAAQLAVFGFTWVGVYQQGIKETGGNPGTSGALAAMIAALLVTVVFSTATMWAEIGLTRWREARKSRRRRSSDQGPEYRIPHRLFGNPRRHLGDAPNARLAREE